MPGLPKGCPIHWNRDHCSANAAEDLRMWREYAEAARWTATDHGTVLPCLSPTQRAKQKSYGMFLCHVSKSWGIASVSKKCNPFMFNGFRVFRLLGIEEPWLRNTTTVCAVFRHQTLFDWERFFNCRKLENLKKYATVLSKNFKEIQSKLKLF